MQAVTSILVLFIACAVIGCRSTSVPSARGLTETADRSEPDLSDDRSSWVRLAAFAEDELNRNASAPVPVAPVPISTVQVPGVQVPGVQVLAARDPAGLAAVSGIQPREIAIDPSADSPPLLSLEDFEEIAWRSNPTLAVASARVQAARGRRLQAGVYPNPTAGYHATEIGNVGTAGQQGAFVSQRIVTGGKLRLDRALADREFDEAHLQFHAQQQRVLSDVRVRFYDLLIAQRRVQLTRDLVRIGDEIAKVTETLIEGRLVSENDLLQAQIKSDESHILLDDALNQHAAAFRRLAAVVGVPSMRMAPVAGELEAGLPSFDWETCYAMVMQRHPALNAARQRVARASVAIRRARKEPLPNVDVMVSVRHHNVTQDDVANVQLGIPLPVFDKNRGNIRAAEAEWAAARGEVQRMELELQDRLAATFRRFASARQHTNRYRRQMIPKAQRSLDLVTRGYEQGQVQYLTLLTAQQTYLQVNLAYLASLRELRTSSTLIEGQLLTDSLADRR